MAVKRAHGIDISFWQEDLLPRPQNQADIDFVILKASQSTWVDPSFERLYASARHFPVRGAYHYFNTLRVLTSKAARAIKKPAKKSGEKARKKDAKAQPGSQMQLLSEEAAGWQEQADFFLSQVQGKDFHFYALDVERGPDPASRPGRTRNIFSGADIANIKRWIEYVREKSGKPVLLYTNQDVYKHELVPRGGQILAGLDLWLAGYREAPNRDEDDPIRFFEIPGVKSWQLWQYSADKNEKGPTYGVKSRDIDLNVFNGSIPDMLRWLGLDVGVVESPLAPVRERARIEEKPEQHEKPAQPATLAEALVAVSARLEKLRLAGLRPQVKIRLDPGELDGLAMEALKARLQGSGGALEVTVDVRLSLDGGAAARPGAAHEPKAGPAQGSGTRPAQEQPAPDRKIPEGFTVIVSEEKTVVQSFKKTDKAGKPIMVPHEPRVILPRGARFTVSAKHRASAKDPGDGTILGTGNIPFYFIVDCPADRSAEGKYVKQRDVRRA